MQYCLYLRKSRADAEAEERGEGETLARHEKALIELARRMKLNITQIYREIVSGETIAARPVMQKLLQEVEAGIWDGVLVMEIERLARGDTIDQGIVAQTFKYSNTKIITPQKTFDPNNEFDEEYFEFGLFMSRREYKTINRRLQRGRIASVMEGKYVGNKAPNGYRRVRIKGDKGYTLEIDEDEAKIVRMIYEWYTKGEKQNDGSYKRIGVSVISRRLNEMKIPTRTGGAWTAPTIRDILINPVYIGKIRWNWRHNVKKMKDGNITITRPRSGDECIIRDGLHPAIISEETFNKAQEIMSKNKSLPVKKNSTIQNPLAGLVVCGKCGRHMTRRPYKNGYPDTLMCSPACDNVSSALNLVEEKILKSIEQWNNEYKLKWKNQEHEETTSHTQVKKKALRKLKAELKTLNTQIDKTHDLLEQGIYDTDTFLDRSKNLSNRIEETKKSIKALEDNIRTDTIREESAKSIIPKAEELLRVYHHLETPQAKNEMLRQVLEKVVYTKNTGTRWHGTKDDFEVEIYPKIPENI